MKTERHGMNGIRLSARAKVRATVLVLVCAIAAVPAARAFPPALSPSGSQFVSAANEPGPAQARTVTSLADTGPGSLREVLARAEAGDEVTFAVTGTIHVSSTLVISQNLTIRGPEIDPAVNGGAPVIAISGGGRVPVFRIAVDANVTMHNVTVADGLATTGRNAAGITNNGSLSMSDCVLRDNVGGAYGGAVYDNEHGSGHVELRRCAFISNRAGTGGAVHIGNSQSDTAVIEDSVFLTNQAESSGGAIFGRSPLRIVRSEFRENSAGIGGGAVDGHADIVDSLLIGNDSGTGYRSTGGGARLYSGSVLRTAIVGNRAPLGGGLGLSGFVTVANSTIAENTAYDTGDHWSGSGGGVYLTGRSELIHVTIAGNTSEVNEGGGIAFEGVGSPYAISYSQPPLILDSVLANNVGGGCWARGDGEAVDVLSGIQWPDESCTGLTVADPALQALAFDGDTWIMLPGQGSAARDAASTSACHTDPILRLDQRRLARPSGSGCDMGAAEANAESMPTPGFTPPASATPLPPDLVPAGALIGYDLPPEGCWRPDLRYGLFATFANYGGADADSFVVEVNGTPHPVDSLDAGGTTTIFSASGQSTTVMIADVNDDVAERYEDNNRWEGSVPVPTMPIPCSVLTEQAATRTAEATLTAEVTLTATATPTPTASATNSPGPGVDVVVWLPRALNR